MHGKSLREHFEVYNHAKAIDYLYSIIEKNKDIYGSEILNLHQLLHDSIEDEYSGRIRNVGVRNSGANLCRQMPIKFQIY